MKVSRNLLKQLRRINEWKDHQGNSSDIDLLDYVGFECTPEIFFALAELFSPELIEYEGGRFLKSHFDSATFYSWQDKGFSMIDAQIMLNHIHVRTIIQGQEVSDELANAIANTIKFFWSLSIKDAHIQVLASTYDDLAVTFSDISKQ